MNWKIRGEGAVDVAAIRDLTLRAFDGHPYTKATIIYAPAFG